MCGLNLCAADATAAGGKTGGASTTAGQKRAAEPASKKKSRFLLCTDWQPSRSSTSVRTTVSGPACFNLLALEKTLQAA